MSEALPGLSAEAVADYLAAHPKFFVGRESLLLSLRLPHTPPGTVSLIERQAALLRERIASLEKALRELHERARVNEGLAVRMHQLALTLLTASSPCEVVEAARARLCSDFDLAAVLIGIKAGHTLVAPCLPCGQNALWSTLFALKTPQMPRSSAPLCELLSAHGLPETASVAAIPLRGRDFAGAMLLVKREPQGFRPDMDTLFLQHIGDLVSTALTHAQ